MSKFDMIGFCTWQRSRRQASLHGFIRFWWWLACYLKSSQLLSFVLWMISSLKKIYLKENPLKDNLLARKSSGKKIFSRENILERKCSRKKIFSRENILKRKSSKKKIYLKEKLLEGKSSRKKILSKESMIEQSCNLGGKFYMCDSHTASIIVENALFFIAPQDYYYDNGLVPIAIERIKTVHISIFL